MVKNKLFFVEKIINSFTVLEKEKRVMSSSINRIPGGVSFFYISWMDSRRVSVCVDYGSRTNLVTQETMARHNLRYSHVNSAKAPRQAVDGNGDVWLIVGETDTELQIEVGGDTVGFHGYVVQPLQKSVALPSEKSKTWNVLVGCRLARTVNYFLFCNPVFY